VVFSPQQTEAIDNVTNFLGGQVMSILRQSVENGGAYLYGNN
jgi:hypothetical protein